MSDFKINSLDFLAVKPHLMIKNEKGLKTSISTWLSLIILLLGSSSGIFFFITFLSKSQVYSNVSKGPFDYFPKTILGKDSFEIFIGFQDPHYSYYDPKTILDISLIQLTQRTIDGIFTTEVKDISFQKCSEIYTTNEISKRNLILPLNLFTCVNYTENSYIQNHWAQESYSSLQYTFSVCKNTTANRNKCQPIEVIENIIQGGFISFFFSNNLVNPKNISSPIQYFIDQNYQILNFVGSTKINYNLNPIELLSDEGVFFENIVTKKSFQAYPPLIFYEFKQSDVICSLIIDGASQGYTTFRFFPKIQDLFTKIGGTINSLVIVAKLIIAILSKHIYLKYLQDFLLFYTPLNVNEEISIDIKKANKMKEKRSQNSMIHLKDLTKNSVLDVKPVEGKNEFNFYPEILKNPLKNKDPHLVKMGLFGFFISQFYPQEMKYNHLKVLKKILENSVSVESLISRNFEFELIKFLIFDGEKLGKMKELLFNYISVQNKYQKTQNIQEYFQQKCSMKTKNQGEEITKNEKLNIIFE